MSDPQVEMIAIAATALERDHVFEMFGNLYQVDATHGANGGIEVHAHLIAQIGTPRAFNGNTTIFLSDQTRVLIEA